MYDTTEGLSHSERWEKWRLVEVYIVRHTVAWVPKLVHLVWLVCPRRYRHCRPYLMVSKRKEYELNYLSCYTKKTKHCSYKCEINYLGNIHRRKIIMNSIFEKTGNVFSPFSSSKWIFLRSVFLFIKIKFQRSCKCLS